MTRTKDKSGAWRPPGQPPALSQAVARMRELQRFFSVPAPYLYRVPEELEPLAARLGLPVPELVQLIDGGRVPLRRRLNKNGSGYGPYRVLIHDVLKVEGIEDRNPPEGRPKGNPWRK